MPDGWEIKYGFDPNVNDAGGDMDRDGLANLYEYLHGANPLKGYITCGDNGPLSVRHYTMAMNRLNIRSAPTWLMVLTFFHSLSGEGASYTNWPPTREWSELTNHIAWCYKATWQRIAVLGEESGLTTNMLAPPSYIYPFDDYRRLAETLDQIAPHYVDSRPYLSAVGATGPISGRPRIRRSFLLDGDGSSRLLWLLLVGDERASDSLERSEHHEFAPPD